MNFRLSLAPLAALLPLLAGCAETFYARTPTGTLSGKLDVEWAESNQFIFRPRPGDPLTYVTAAGRRIQPGVMHTDGGSVPRFFWSMPDFGPWDFGPAYILHDWLFQQHHCKLGDWQQDTLGSTADVLAEAIKTQMAKANRHDAFAVWAIHRAVSGSVAQERWDSGSCMPPPVSSGKGAVRIFTIDADAMSD